MRAGWEFVTEHGVRMIQLGMGSPGILPMPYSYLWLITEVRVFIYEGVMPLGSAGPF
jgi:hypothetical protein